MTAIEPRCIRQELLNCKRTMNEKATRSNIYAKRGRSMRLQNLALTPPDLEALLDKFSPGLNTQVVDLSGNGRLNDLSIKTIINKIVKKAPNIKQILLEGTNISDEGKERIVKQIEL